MEKALEEKLEKVEEDLNWAGMHADDMVDITQYTLDKLKEYLDETGATNEAATIQEALDLCDTHLET